MNDNIHDELLLERKLNELFGVSVDMNQTIVDRIPVGRMAKATVFLTSKKQLYVYIEGQSKLVLDDIKKITTRMGLKIELYLPPKNRPDYFNEIGKENFKSVFPGRTHITDDDIRFYRTLAPYNPALALVKEVEGTIYQFDSDTAGDKWRKATKFTYRRIRTS